MSEQRLYCGLTGEYFDRVWRLAQFLHDINGRAALEALVKLPLSALDEVEKAFEVK
jgi:hypothetical protein